MRTANGVAAHANGAAGVHVGVCSGCEQPDPDGRGVCRFCGGHVTLNWTLSPRAQLLTQSPESAQPSPPLSLREELRDAQAETFLTELAQHGRIGEAAATAGVDRKTVARWIAEDPEFRAAVAQARNSRKQSPRLRLPSQTAWTHEIRLPSGGRIGIVMDVDLFALSESERRLVFQVVDALRGIPGWLSPLALMDADGPTSPSSIEAEGGPA